jgi:acyl transferase domain-containing protein
LGADGKSYAFDHRALGYGRGEGVANIVLKPLQDALRDNDPIRAVIRTTGLNQDGRTNGITLPDPKAQEDLIRSCYQNAGLDPAHTPYVEAHGTGTIGDQLEAGAISAVFSPDRASDSPVYVASVKTNIGHTEATSGLAGIIKAVLALEKGLIPPSINFEKPHPEISLEKLKIKIPTSLEPWPSGSYRRASVNSFGYGGTNGHVILDHVSSYLPQPKALSNGYEVGDSRGAEGRLRIFSFSANDEETVRKMLPTFVKYFRQKQEEDPRGEEAVLNNLAYTLAHRRSRFSWTATTPARTLQELVELVDSNKVIPSRRSEDIRLGFVFNGQGAQWYAMGRELISAYPVFRNTVIAADKRMKRLGADWSILGPSLYSYLSIYTLPL